MRKGKSKILTREEIAKSAKREGIKAIGFTSGVFDLVHPGHVRYLEEARSKCDFLIVGVNSDSSVRSNKGEKRPICFENSRLEVVASLEAVDAAFLFSEANNNNNIEILKPDIYFKAGDYDKSKLSSAPLVESYGGRVEIIPFAEGFSSTAIIDRICSVHDDETPRSNKKEPYKLAPAVFVDRDGTINEPVEYLHEPSKFKVLKGALEGLRRFKEKGYRIVVVTNQPGIGFGYFTKEDFFAVNKEMLRQAHKAGVAIDRIYYSPYSQADNTTCRKPGTALIERAVNDLNLDLKASMVIGDTTSDIEMGRKLGIRTVLVTTGEGGKDGKFKTSPDLTVDSIADAAKAVLGDP